MADKDNETVDWANPEQAQNEENAGYMNENQTEKTDEEKKGKRRTKQQMIDDLTAEKQSLEDKVNQAQTQVITLTNEKALLFKQYMQEKREKQSAQNELLKYGALLEEARNANKALLSEMSDTDDDEDEKENKAKFLIISDIPDEKLRPYFDSDKYEWTAYRADSIPDIMSVLDDSNIVDNFKKFDKIILKTGTDQLGKGEKPSLIATQILRVVEKLFRKVQKEVTVIHVPPTPRDPHKSMMINQKLTRLMKPLTYTQEIHLAKPLEDEIKADLVEDDGYTLNDQGVEIIIRVLLKEIKPPNPDNIPPLPSTSQISSIDTKSQASISQATIPKKRKFDETTPKRDDNTQKRDDDIEESIFIPQNKVGRIIGKSGTRIRALRKKAKCGIKVVKVNNSDMALIRGLPDNVLKAEEVIRKLLNDDFFSMQNTDDDIALIETAAK